MKCVICKETITSKTDWKGGHNAEPVKKGRCCDECNYTVVTPIRIQEFLISKKADKTNRGN